jgi:hypothetical protein
MFCNVPHDLFYAHMSFIVMFLPDIITEQLQVPNIKGQQERVCLPCKRSRGICWSRGGSTTRRNRLCLMPFLRWRFERHVNIIVRCSKRRSSAIRLVSLVSICIVFEGRATTIPDVVRKAKVRRDHLHNSWLIEPAFSVKLESVCRSFYPTFLITQLLRPRSTT